LHCFSVNDIHYHRFLSALGSELRYCHGMVALAMSNTSNPILFASATIVDGSEDAKPFVADVLIRDGLIERIGTSIEAGGARRIDAAGFYLCPGFIDMHAHSDLYLLTNPMHEAKVSQGCTVRFPIILTDHKY
jgi:adenine deaminase